MNKKPEYTLVEPDPSTDAELAELAKQGKQLTWMIHADNKTIGMVWIELEDSEYLESPSTHITIEDKIYHENGTDTAAVKEMIKYAYCNLTSETLYSRHLVDDSVVEELYKKLGFENDEKPYTDTDGHEWQNIKLTL